MESSPRDSYARALREVRYLEATSDEAYDRLISLTTRTLKMPLALVCLLDISRQWFQFRMGICTAETHRDIAFCTYTILETSPDVLVIPDALQDDRFCDNPMVVGDPFIRFYAGAALRVQGNKVGTLCVIDTKPRHDFGAKEQQTLLDIAGMVSSLIEARQSSVLQLEQELAHITMSVLYSIKQPLEALTEVSRVLDGKWRHLQASSMASRVEHDQQDPEAAKEQPQEQPQQSLRQETIAAVQEDAILLQDKADILKLFLDLSLKAASRLLDMGQSGSKHPRLVACDLEGLISKAEAMVSRCSPSYEMDWRLGPIKSLCCSHNDCSPLLSPRNYKAATTPETSAMQVGLQALFTHPDLILLIIISMATLLSAHGKRITSIHIEKVEKIGGLSLTEGRISKIIAKNVTPSSRSAIAKVDEYPQYCEGSLKLYLVAQASDEEKISGIYSLKYLVDGVGGSFEHELQNDGSLSRFTIAIPYLQGCDSESSIDK